MNIWKKSGEKKTTMEGEGSERSSHCFHSVIVRRQVVVRECQAGAKDVHDLVFLRLPEWAMLSGWIKAIWLSLFHMSHGGGVCQFIMSVYIVT